MSKRGVVENWEETPSSQLRAFWRERLGAACYKIAPYCRGSKPPSRRLPLTSSWNIASRPHTEANRRHFGDAGSRNGENGERIRLRTKGNKDLGLNKKTRMVPDPRR
ncbi:hypothetical protein L2E82_08301 [Cichorium intybus]|uniref:Uncharacterized protein n=1 Tax=Cichorium intybus TaxID=13427 RepID=A0ACB9G672_CICIN|nr:hypothetical protein L2E82_08301 [Cichorium intybus]